MRARKPTGSTALALVGDVFFERSEEEQRLPARRVMPLSVRRRDSGRLFGNLEGLVYSDADARALRAAGFALVGSANNMTFGERGPARSARILRRVGVRQVGWGTERAAYAGVVLVVGGLRIGFLQRTSVFWPPYAATPKRSGVAVLRANTAYVLPVRTDKPGTPPRVMSWVDEADLDPYRAAVRALRKRADVVVASHHWGFRAEVLEYQTQIARCAIDSGADIVVGHGPHVILPVEFYQDRPIFYGLGSFAAFPSVAERWHLEAGVVVTVALSKAGVDGVSARVLARRRSGRMEVAPPSSKEVRSLRARSKALGTRTVIKRAAMHFTPMR